MKIDSTTKKCAIKIKLLFIIIALVKFTIANAQAPGINWEKTLGGTGSDYSSSVANTYDSGFVIAGYTNSNNGDVTGYHGYVDVWLVKVDKHGSIQWERALGGSLVDVGYSVSQTSDSGYIVCGYSESTDGDIKVNKGSFDLLILKVTKTGSLAWAKTYGGSGQDIGTFAQETKDHGYIAIGYSNSNDGDVSGNHGGNDFWVLKLNDTGAIQWEKSFGGSSDDEGYYIEQTKDSNYIACGYNNSNDGQVSFNHGLYDCWITKLNDTGALVWEKSLGGSNYEEAESIHQTKDGGFITSGFTYSNDGDVTGNHGSSDGWLVKLKSDGSLDWQKTIGGSSDEVAEYVYESSDSALIITGFTNSNDGDIAVNKGDFDYLLAKIDKSSNLLWTTTVGGDSVDEAGCVVPSPNGYTMVGATKSNDGDITGKHGGSSNLDIWLVQMTNNVYVNNIVLNENKVSFYPVPCESTLNYKVTNEFNGGKAIITDDCGKVVKIFIIAGSGKLDISSLVPGNYVVTISGKGQTAVKKITKIP